ncbi:YihY/virulence factor BrkB family protein [Paracoccus hibiscisoli]|uniref:YihY/virulence factor BrkB family protein n=1 Tax=Paracoccus hibiscisoli TaxID=2023261 RepID=A0A4U0QNH7_9RHOB|nr:YihY/virulence factor BrkB family protein [Paracoccus hibiscisoli]TJZ83070.1 YihY/virulence factor BrkB family protein [Paracoccus hibiscisoli]
MTRQPGIADAFFAPLDQETRQRFGLEGDQPADAAPTGPQPGLRDMSRADVIAVAKSTVKQIGEDRVTSVSGGVTFFGLLSLFPAITAFVSLYGLWADPTTIQSHLAMLEDLLPESSLEIIRGQVVSIASASTGALSVAGFIALLVAFWSANGGMKALLSALNVAVFQRETRGFVRLNLVAMAFTLGGLAMIVLMLGVIAVLPWVLRLLPIGWGAETILSIIRWPLMLGLLVLALAAVYRWGPAAPKSRWRWVSPGAVFAALALVITSMLFSWYAVNFGNYNETYGSLGAVIALMTWLWLNATIVLVGAEINSELERHLKHMAGLSDERPLSPETTDAA